MKQVQTRIIAFVAVLLIASQVMAACAPARKPASQPVAPAYGAAQPAMEMINMPMADSNKSTARIDRLIFRQAVRKLWEDHITWTRVYIISALAGLPEADTAAGRLLQNQTDIGDAIKPFYGNAAGDQLTSSPKLIR